MRFEPLAVAWVLACCAPPAPPVRSAPTPSPPAPHSWSLELRARAIVAAPITHFEARLERPDGTVATACSARVDARRSSPFVCAARAAPRRGRYRVLVRAGDDRGRVVAASTALPLDDLDDTDEALDVEVDFATRTSDARPFVAWLRVDRVRRAPRSVRLRRAWTPSRDALPAYALVNGGARPLFGLVLGGSFLGEVQRDASGSWTPYAHVGICGTLGPEEPLAPGATRLTDEGPPLVSTPFEPGRYRYVLRYALDPPPPFPRADVIDAGHTASEVRVVYEVAAPFAIRRAGASAFRPP